MIATILGAIDRVFRYPVYLYKACPDHAAVGLVKEGECGYVVDDLDLAILLSIFEARKEVTISFEDGKTVKTTGKVLQVEHISSGGRSFIKVCGKESSLAPAEIRSYLKDIVKCLELFEKEA